MSLFISNFHVYISPDSLGFCAMAENTEIESLKREFENAAAELKEAKERDATGSGILCFPLAILSRYY